MKLSFREIESFVRSPSPAVRVVLVYGPDYGLMQERSAVMGRTVVADLNDPFNAVTLSAAALAENPGRLFDEAAAISMMGGARLILVDEAGDKLTTLLKSYLEAPSDETLVILKGGDLGPRSSLRKLCEAAKNAAAVPCYVEDERDLSRLIRGVLEESGLRIEADAAGWLAANIGGDRARARSELEKLVVYKGEAGGAVTLDDVTACCGEAGVLALDDLVYSAAGGQPGQTLRSFDRLMEEGLSFIVILRALQNHFSRLHLVRARMDEGDSADQAMKVLSPPVFFKQQAAFKAQAGRWSLSGLLRVLERLGALEAQCKQTGAPVQILCAQAVLGISKSRG